MTLEPSMSACASPNSGRVVGTQLRAAARYWELQWSDEMGEHALRFSLREVADSYEARLRRRGLAPRLDRHSELDRECHGAR